MPYTMRNHDARTRRVLERIGRTMMLARVGQGLSQRDLEALTHVDQSTICRLENGRAPGIRLDKIATIIAVLAIDQFDSLRTLRELSVPTV
jgi:transcriptional regulator with XRE-family HTH domain